MTTLYLYNPGEIILDLMSQVLYSLLAMLGITNKKNALFAKKAVVAQGIARPDIYQFDDAVDYLAAAIKYIKAKNSSFSQRALARILHISSPGFFNLVLHRKRPLSLKLIEDIEKFLVGRGILEADELNYFHHLAKIGLTEDIDEKTNLRTLLGQLKRDKENHQLSNKDLDAFSRWETIALFEALQLKGFKYEADYLHRLFKKRIPAQDLIFMVQHLVRRGLLEHTDGELKRSVSTVKSTCDVPSDQLRSLHKQFLEEAIKNIETTDVKFRDFNSYTMCVKKDKIPEAKKLIRDFKSKMAQLFETSAGDTIYQLNVQLFPILGEDENEK